jgi:hypothetical protein
LFVLTNATNAPYLRVMTLGRTVQIIQVAYPQVYLACHTRHQRKRTSVHRLSSRDSSILAHPDPVVAMKPAQLAAPRRDPRDLRARGAEAACIARYVECR